MGVFGTMLFAEISDTVWLGIIGIVGLVVKEYFDRDRASKAEAKADADRERAKTAADADRERAKVAEKTMTDKQDANHNLLNGNLIEVKRLIAEKAKAEGELAGAAKQKAETDAKAAGAAEAMKLAAMQPPVAPQPTEPATIGPVPVTVVTGKEPLKVTETPEPKA
jgi:hypothetical protein